jgi:hypothetical protein
VERLRQQRALRPCRVGRDRARRLAESLLVLAELRWIGSQKACPELKKLMGRVNRFYEVRGV